MRKEGLYLKVTKKLISLALAVAMAATGFSLPAFAAGSPEVIDPTDYMSENWTVYDHYGTNWDRSVNDDLHPYQVADSTNSDGKRVQGYFTDVMSGNDLVICHNFDRHIMVKGDSNSSSVLFAGYGKDAMADFMIYRSASSAKKVVSFDLDFARIDTHTLSGSMIFVNSKIENGKLDGYIIYFPANKGSSVLLLKATQADAAAMSASSTVTSFSGVSRVASLPAYNTSSSSSKIHIEMEIDPTHLLASFAQYERVTDGDGNTSLVVQSPVALYDGDIEDTGAGIGVGADYKSHNCSSLTRIEFSDFRMMSGYTVRYIRNFPSDADPVVEASDTGIEPGETYTVNAVVGTTPDVSGVEGSANYDFLGWNDKADGSGAYYKMGDSFSVNKATDIFGIWKKKAAGLNFSPDDGKWPDGFNEKGETASLNVPKEMGDPIAAADRPAKSPEKEWYVVDGWQFEDGMEVLFDGSQSMTSTFITVKPIWKEDFNKDGIPDEDQSRFTVSFEDADHGTLTGDRSFTVIKTGSDLIGDAIEISKEGKTLPVAKPDSGYAFTGWDTTGDGAADYMDNETLKNAEVSANLTVRPVYVPAYTVKFASGPNGSISGRDTFAILNKAGSVTLGDAEGGFSAPGARPNDGYDFKGWDTDGDGAPDVQTDGLAALSVNGNTTITAVFDKGAAVQDVWNVTIVTSGGSTRVKVPDGESLGDRLPKDGDIIGWMDEDGNPVDKDTPITGNRTVTAQYAPSSSGGEEEPPVVPAPPKRPGRR